MKLIINVKWMSMKSFFEQPVSSFDAAVKRAGNKIHRAKLYVAFRNSAMIDSYTSANNEDAGFQSANTKNTKSSVFSTTGGMYYINGVPVIYSEEDEAILYADEYAEYY
jgi:hypothetical protein